MNIVSNFVLTLIVQSLVHPANANDFCKPGEAFGRETGVMALVMVPEVDAASWLPKGTQFMSGLCQGGHCPTYIFLGEQRNIQVPESSEIPWTYEEAMLVNVGVIDGNGKPAVHMPKLFLNHKKAIKAGREIWGIPKFMARIIADEKSYFISRKGKPILKANLERHGEFRPISDFPSVQAMFASENTNVVQKKNGKLLNFNIRYNYSSKHFGVRPVSVSLDIIRSFQKGIPVGRLNIASVSKDPLGAFEFSADWCMEIPKNQSAN